MEKHHRKPKAQKGRNNRRNISYVPKEEHRAWHVLFNGDLTPQEIAKKINAQFLDPDWFMVAIDRRR